MSCGEAVVLGLACAAGAARVVSVLLRHGPSLPEDDMDLGRGLGPGLAWAHARGHGALVARVLAHSRFSPPRRAGAFRALLESAPPGALVAALEALLEAEDAQAGEGRCGAECIGTTAVWERALRAAARVGRTSLCARLLALPRAAAWANDLEMI
jgi:hypothetical protein